MIRIKIYPARTLQKIVFTFFVQKNIITYKSTRKAIKKELDFFSSK